ncbi:MAG: DUF4982 domain-containing protein [Lachnospiraceae bacterium]|nr:DUF4982 domain-containing protein [Lachnospiraceae bacterium]
MRAQKWNDNWKFWEDKDSFALVWNVPEIARTVTLPHDAMLERRAYAESPNMGNTGFRDGGVYTYVKNLTVTEEMKDRLLMLKFEGVYMNAMVYVNGQLAGKNMFGYTTFYVPLNDFVYYGKDNEIRVQVRNSGMTNSRWYSGSGIYRDVYLLESDLTCLVPEGIRIMTESADDDYAVLRVTSELKNLQHAPADLILETVLRDDTGKEAAREHAAVTLSGMEERTLSQKITVDDPRLWSDENPELYTYEILLKSGDTVVDAETGTFGIRTLQLDAKRGLRVNGRSVKLRGACVHHDSGLLGAATCEEFPLRQATRLKEAGFNAIRSSHQPIAPAMLKACDEVGIYVMDEFSDMWNRLKSDLDYGLYFQEWWEKDVTAMVRRDYNHPCIVLYSIGNEIPEIGSDFGAKICYEINKKIKELDDTRYTTAGINGVFAAGDRIGEIMADLSGASADGDAQSDSDTQAPSGNVNDFMTMMDTRMNDIVVHRAISEKLEKACAYLDVAGYNYMTARYQEDAVNYPNRVIVGSETYPPEIARNWGIIKNASHVIGDFTWTGWDYIGEAGVGIPAYHWGDGGFGANFPAQLAYCGDIDITGVRRPASYYRECVFGLRKEPYIAVQDPNHYGEPLIKTPWVLSDAISSWTWKGCEGKPVIIEVYAPEDEVELFVNGKSLGRKPSGEAVGFRTFFETIYEPGTVKAVLYKMDDAAAGTEEPIAQTELVTAAEPETLELICENTAREELLFIDVRLLDAAGIPVTGADCKLKAEVSGAAALAGFGSGNPKPDYNYIDGTADTWNGTALLILRKSAAGGSVHVKISAENGLSGELEITC